MTFPFDCTLCMHYAVCSQTKLHPTILISFHFYFCHLKRLSMLNFLSLSLSLLLRSYSCRCKWQSFLRVITVRFFFSPSYKLRLHLMKTLRLENKLNEKSVPNERKFYIKQTMKKKKTKIPNGCARVKTNNHKQDNN